MYGFALQTDVLVQEYAVNESMDTGHQQEKYDPLDDMLIDVDLHLWGEN